jgi:hypothetical protein
LQALQQVSFFLAYATLLEEDRSPRKRGDGTGIAGVSTIRLLAMTPDEENGLAETLWVDVVGCAFAVSPPAMVVPLCFCPTAGD